MDTLFHFVFPMIAALAARLKIKHPIRTIFAASSLTFLIDLDHFIGSGRMMFHNVFVTMLIPLILLFLSFHFKLDRYAKGFFLLLLILLSSHVFLDLFNPVLGEGIDIREGEGIALFYPLNNVMYTIDFNIKISKGYIVSSLGFGILSYLIIIIVPCFFLDDIIEIAEVKHEKFMKATKELFKGLIKD